MLQINTEFSEFDQYPILFIRGPDAMTYEAIAVASFTATTVTIDTPLVSSWPRGAFVYPGYLGVLTDRAEAAKKSDQLFQMTARFMVYGINRHERLYEADFESYLFHTQPIITYDLDNGDREIRKYEPIKIISIPPMSEHKKPKGRI